jgi:hypothetical protein
MRGVGLCWGVSYRHTRAGQLAEHSMVYALQQLAASPLCLSPSAAKIEGLRQKFVTAATV